LDCTLWESDESAEKCRKALGVAPSVETISVGGEERREKVLPFDLGRAHELYKALLGPVEDMIGGKHLLIVPSGPLTSLPFGVLVTEAPAGVRPSGSDTIAQRGVGTTVSDPKGLTPSVSGNTPHVLSPRGEGNAEHSSL
jgi:hypothetical protein